MLRRLDGPSKQGSLTVDNVTVQELKKDAQPFKGRSVITLRADQKVLIYFGDDSGVAPSAVTVAADGIPVFKNEFITIEAGNLQHVYILADSTTAEVKFVERG